MRTLFLVAGGLALLGFFLLAAKQFGGRSALARSRAAWAFVPVWFAVACLNLWLGMQAGYSFLAEVPFFLAVLAVPSVVAVLVARRNAAEATRAPVHIGS